MILWMKFLDQRIEASIILYSPVMSRLLLSVPLLVVTRPVDGFTRFTAICSCLDSPGQRITAVVISLGESSIGLSYTHAPMVRFVMERTLMAVLRKVIITP